MTMALLLVVPTTLAAQPAQHSWPELNRSPASRVRMASVCWSYRSQTTHLPLLALML